jgi:SAM-dependent methyltransferase
MDQLNAIDPEGIHMKQRDLVAEAPSKMLEEFLERYAARQKVHIELSRILIGQALRYYRGQDYGASYLKSQRVKWYNALEKGEPDYSIYDDEFYFTDLWACWVIYSRQYLMDIRRPNSLSAGVSVLDRLVDVKSVVDLGCGIGYSTALLKQIFPHAAVYGTNITGTKQYDFCKMMASIYDFKIGPPDLDFNEDLDLVFASEYFEHIFDAPDSIRVFLEAEQPKFLLIANSFNTQSVGHFRTYKMTDHLGDVKFVQQSRISRKFNDIVRSCGYRKEKTKLWNQKPMLWIRSSTPQA